tara:strand:+ start:14638 stop:16422 length:1785 start_codon:yes stop_codon:yes gene_type:complete
MYAEAWRLFAMMTIMGVLELAGVVSILPFIAVVADPEILEQDGPLGIAYSMSGFSDTNGFLVLLGAAIFLLLLAGNGFKALTTWWINRYTYLAGHEIGLNLVRSYLSRSYEYFLTRNTAEIGTKILSEVQQVASNVLRPALTALARLVAVLFLAGALIVVDPVLALVVAIVQLACFGAIYAVSRPYLTKVGMASVKANNRRFHVVSETFGGIKEVILHGIEEKSVERFSKPSTEYAISQAINRTLAQTPRFAIEVVAFGGVLGIVLYLLASRGGIGEALPLIGLYAFAGYRLLPNLQEIFASLSTMRFSGPSLDLLYDDIHTAPPPSIAPRETVEPIPFLNEIRLEDVEFHYRGMELATVSGLNLVIKRGQRVGFAGSTGAGKSTTIDLLLGLLVPTSGKVMVDDADIAEPATARRWQAGVGYVPQHIFLADDTIAANIAFGKTDDKADKETIIKAAKLAQLHDFIENELPDGYNTMVGERGVRLSGGQRQRLGLARALCGSPSVLVLDEATSALDNATEEAVVEGLSAIEGDCTVLMIAHRLSTIRKCDTIFVLDQGRLAAQGVYDELVESSDVFRRLHSKANSGATASAIDQ